MTSYLQRAFFAWLGMLMLCAFPSAIRAQAPTDLFFSEYIEGSSNNKALEIYNGTGAPINLATSQYVVQVYSNGSNNVTATISLTGTVASNGVYVLANNNANVNVAISSKANQTSGSVNYNGNDAVVLRKGGATGTIVDVIGQIGNDPGAEWGSGLTSTADNTLRRKATLCSGDNIGSDAFNPAIQWDGFAVDTFDGLGSHTADCGGTTPSLPSVSITATDAAGAEAGSDPVTFTLSRTGSTDADLTVNYTIGGTATNGTDYTPALSGVVVIPAGQSSVSLTLTPVDDAIIDANETIILTVAANAAYSISSASATAIIADDEITPSQRIHNIQGAAHISPLLGQVVNNVPGIVTGLRSNGFYLQDPTPDNDERTSEGIFVFTSTAPTVAVGTSLLVSGTVAEFRSGGSAGSNNLTITQIQAPTIVTVSTGNALPAPTLLGNGGRTIPNTIIEDQTGNVETGGLAFDPATDGIDFYESVEGMLVQINNPLAVSPTVRSGAGAGEIWVVADNGANATIKSSRGGVIVSANDFNPERIQLDDTMLNPPSGGYLTPTVNVGAQLSTVVGIVSWVADNYEVLVTSAPTVISNGLTKESTTLAPTANQLTVSTFNVENLAPGDPSSKFNNLASRIVNNLKTPDILLLEEIQDNNGATNDAVVDANVTFDLLINAITAAGGPAYQYRQINPVDDQDGGQAGGNIRVGFLFNPNRVTFVDRPGGTSTAATTVNNVNGVPQLSFNPGRVDPTNPAFANNDGSGPASNSRKPLAGEFLFNGQPVFIIGNHFSSKIPDDILYGVNQPATLFSETQRREQATVVRNFVQSILAINPNANVIALGDLNDFEFSTPVNILKGAPLNSLIETLPANERYTYNFEGNSQTIDHILVSNSLLGKLDQYDVVHINAEFTDPDSDHDPSVARFNFAPPVTPLVLSATATPTQLLTTGTTTLSAAVSGGTTPYSYTFSGPGTITPSGNTATVASLPAGVQTFTITAGDATAPTAQITSTTVSVTVIEPVVANLTGSAAICVGATATLSVAVSGGTAPYTVVYTDGQSSSTLTGYTSGSPIVVAPNQTTTYSLVSATDANGLASTNLTGTATVTVNRATASIAGTLTVCTGQTTTLTAQGGSSYNWSTNATTAAITVGAGTYTVRVTDANQCTATASATVTEVATPTAPTLLTQGGQSAVTVVQASGDVTLVAGGCSGTLSWTGPNNSAGTSNTILVSTNVPGTFVYTAVCRSAGGCVSAPVSATVTVQGLTLTVSHKNGNNNNKTGNTIRPYLKLNNGGAAAIPYGELTVRYWLTVENFAPMTNLFIDWAQLGTNKVKLKYVALPQPRQGALGYVEYSFDASAGSLAPNGTSGEIQSRVAKQNWTDFNEADDHSYSSNNNYAVNNKITVYRNGVLVNGVEPALVTPTRTLTVYAENKNRNTTGNQIKPYLNVANEGNLPVDYSQLTVRYWFTAEGNQPLVYTVDYAELGNNKVTGRFVKENRAGADTYLELSFSPTLGTLYPLSSTGQIQQRINKNDWSNFNEANDYSYIPAGSVVANPKITAYLNGSLVYGQEPGAANGRIGADEPGTDLQVSVLGNPVLTSDVQVDVLGAQGQPLRFLLTDVNGRTITEHQVEQATAAEHQTLKLGNQPAGLLLLHVSTPSQAKTVKLIRQ
ncbi:cellulose binding domain-containing protein [Fibrella sp. WM1]|uniref:cellulose binding domain-containing protein n=1 Tax=Fibrella musci TaxID=3242485 RepID=UPI003522CC32